MNSSMIFEGISGISDAHVAEFANVEKKNRSARRKLAVWFAPVAACLCVALGIALILKLSGVFGTDDPMPNASYDYKKVSFSSFEQFASTVPDASLIDRLKKQCNYALEYNGVIDLTNKKQSQSNYDCYLVVLFDEKTVVAEISIVPDEDENAYKRTAENHSLTNRISICGTAVNYARNDNEEYWEAVFHSNGEDYSILFYPNSEQALIELLRIMLSE